MNGIIKNKYGTVYENKKQVNKFKLKRESSVSWVEKNNDLKAEKNGYWRKLWDMAMCF